MQKVFLVYEIFNRMIDGKVIYDECDYSKKLLIICDSKEVAMSYAFKYKEAFFKDFKFHYENEPLMEAMDDRLYRFAHLNSHESHLSFFDEDYPNMGVWGELCIRWEIVEQSVHSN